MTVANNAETLALKVKQSKRKKVIAWTIAGIFSAIYLVISLAPFIFMVLNSFKH